MRLYVPAILLLVSITTPAAANIFGLPGDTSREEDAVTTQPVHLALVSTGPDTKVAKSPGDIGFYHQMGEAYSLDNLIITIQRRPQTHDIVVNYSFNTTAHGGYDYTPRNWQVDFLSKGVLTFIQNAPVWEVHCDYQFRQNSNGAPSIPYEDFDGLTAVSIPPFSGHSAGC